MLADEKTGSEEKSPIHVADVIRMLGLNSASFEKETSRGEVPATQSSSRSGSRSDRAEVPLLMVHKVLEPGRGTETGVQTDSVEPPAKCKRVRFDLLEYGEGPNNRSRAAKADVKVCRGEVPATRRQYRAGL